MERNVRYRLTKNRIFKYLVIGLSLLAALPLFVILFYIFRKGIAAINWDFIVNLPKPVGETGGGIYNALIGTLILIGMAAVIALPLGISIGTYLSEYRKSKLAHWTRLSVDVLQGIPSIVIGIIIYLWVVKTTGSFSAISGSIALVLLMLPPIIKSTEETLKLIPGSLREASLALGVPYFRTILRVIIPAGMSGVLSGAILSIARVAGETAPLLFTAFGSPFMNTDPGKPIASLPLAIFNYAISPYEEWHRLAWGASFVLIIAILILNLLTKLAERKWKVQF